MHQCVSKSSLHALVSNLKSCTGLKQGRLAHDQIVQGGHESHVVIGTSLIDMYAKGGSLDEAQRVFDLIACRDVAAWNVMITGYAQDGHCLLALELFGKLQLQGFQPSKASFLIALKACSLESALVQTRLLHAQIVSSGLQSDVVIGSSLIDVYSKCGSLEDAIRVFKQLTTKNIVSWGAMMAGYVQHGLGLPALDLFTKMQQEGIRPSKVIFTCILKACGCIRGLEQGRLIHDQLRNQALCQDPEIGNALVDMYAKCGNLDEAHRVFKGIPSRHEISWGAMMAGYVQHGHPFLALQLFESMQMQHVGMKANKIIFSCILKACSLLGLPRLGRVVHELIIRDNLEVDLGNCLIGMYACLGCVIEAQKVFDCLPSKDIGSWDELIAGYAKQGYNIRALELFEKLEQKGMLPSEATFSCILKACGGQGAIEQGWILHEQAIKSGFMLNVVVANGLIDMYLKCGSLREAQSVFDHTSHRDVISWNMLIAGYIQADHCLDAVDIFNRMVQGHGSKPNRVTYLSVLKACGSIGAVQQGRSVHEQITRDNLELDMVVGSSLIDMYASCGSLEEAQKVFDWLPNHDVVSWGALIAGYAQHGHWRLARECLHKMGQCGLTPDPTTFTMILVSCCQTGQVEEGYTLIKSMEEEHGIAPNVEQFNCMVDLLGRAGRLSEAVQLVHSMPDLPNVMGWMSLLSACRRHGEVNLARECFDKIVRVDPENSAGYTLMSQIYADTKMWDDLEKMEGIRKYANAWKKPANAWIQLSDRLHEFSVEDANSAQNELVDTRLKAVRQQIRQAGYIPEVDLIFKHGPVEGIQDVFVTRHSISSVSFGFSDVVQGMSMRIITFLNDHSYGMTYAPGGM